MELVEINFGTESTMKGDVQYGPGNEEVAGGISEDSTQEILDVTKQPEVARQGVADVPAMWTEADLNHRAIPRSRGVGGTRFWPAGRQAH